MKKNLKVLLLALLFLISCAKTSSSDNNPTVTPNSKNSSGIYYMSYQQLNRFVPGALPEKLSDISSQSTALLGSNGNFFTDFEVLSLGKGFQINLRQQSEAGIQNARTITLNDTNYFIRGPVQPSSDGGLLIIPISATSGDGLSPRNNGFNVVGGLSRIFYSHADAVDPVWISDTEIVSGNKDELQRHNIEITHSSTRLGPFGLGAPGADVRQLAVSPNHQRIAFIQNDAIYAINVDGTGLQQLTLSSPGLNWPAWSPDGNQIIVVTTQCPELGSGVPNPEIIVISSMIGSQNAATAQRLVQSNGTPFRACGPLYWK